MGEQETGAEEGTREGLKADGLGLFWEDKCSLEAGLTRSHVFHLCCDPSSSPGPGTDSTFPVES